MITDTEIWLTIAGLALLTYAIRLSFLGLFSRRAVPERLTRALALVPVTVLPALIALMVFRGEGGGLGLDPGVVSAAALTLVAGMATRNVLAGLAGGIAGFALASLLV